jgi:outer membrane protein OmpA-like peptidoglycan-associated protein
VVDADPDPAGGYMSRLPPGDYSVDVVANGFHSRPRQITVEAGGQQTVDVQLRKKPKVSHVSLGKGEIVLKGVIHFVTNGTDIQPDGQQLLDEVVDILVANPQIKRVRIEGHTDNKGRPEANLALSKGRAHSVMAYLVKQGIDPARLESEGFGASQPLVPNITAANRAKNRRVAFKIIE